jgi:hypothetical protein
MGHARSSAACAGVWWGGGGIRRSSSRVRVRVREHMRFILFRRLCFTRLRLDRGCMVMRFARVGRVGRLFKLLLGCWIWGLLSWRRVMRLLGGPLWVLLCRRRRLSRFQCRARHLGRRRPAARIARVPTDTSEDGDIDININIDVDGDEDVDSHRGGLHRLRRRQEHDIEVDVEG